MKLRKDKNTDKNVKDYGKKKQKQVHEENPYTKYMPDKQDSNKFKPKKKKL